MDGNEKIKTKNDVVSIWFGFPLNKTNSIVLFVLSFMGVMSLPALIFENISYIFYYNSFGGYYTLINIIFYSVSFSLSLYTFLKVIKGITTQEKQKKVLESRITQVPWFGIKLAYNQALVLFALSLSGILFSSYYLVLLIFDYVNPPFGFLLFYFGNYFTHIFVLIISIFTAHRIKKPRIIPDSAKELNTISLFLFILSIVLFISLIFPTLVYGSMLIFNIITIILFDYIHYGGLIYVITLIICISLLVLSALNIKRKYDFSISLKKSSKISQKPKWLGLVKMNHTISLIFLSFSIFVVLYLLFSLSIEIFIVGSIVIDMPAYVFFILLLLIPCFYIINFILKKNRLELFLELYFEEKSSENKWFGLKVNRSQSTIIFWLSLFSGSYLIYLIISLLIRLPMILSYIEPFPEVFKSRYLIRISVSLFVQCVMVIIYSYSMIITRKFLNSKEKLR